MRKRFTIFFAAVLCVVPLSRTAAQDSTGSSRCRRRPASAKVACYQDLLSARLRTGGVAGAMSLLDTLNSTDRVVRDNNHMFAHMLGLAAYTNPAELAKVFSQCSPNFQSGCYHGVIQAYFVDRQHKNPNGVIGATEINALCKDFRGRDDRWLLFQCVHGLGHGLEFVYAHDLPRSLGGCDLVADGWERSGCYGGAFMENVVSVTNPEQTAEHMTEGGASNGMQGMDMGGMDHSTAATPFKRFDSENPLYPCSGLPDRYGSECYAMQTSLILFENQGDFRLAGTRCEAAPAAFRSICFISLGRDANSYASDNPVEAARSCMLAPEAFRPWCHVGVAKNTVELTARPADGFKYCAALGEDASKVTCYVAIGEEIGLLSATLSRKKEMCSVVPSPFDAACLYGAGASTHRPDGLARPQ